MEINPQELPPREVYKLMSGSIVPRPIAWVSTVDADGNANLAPYSFFNAVCANPPTVMFSVGYRYTDDGQKDTFHNVKATEEFVINFVNESTAEAMNITAVEVPPDVDEFERAGLSAIPSKLVKPPRVGESPIAFECKLNQIVTINAGVGGGHIIIGEVVYMHFADGIYQEGNYINLEAYEPIARMMGGEYAHLNDFFTIERPPSELKPE